MRVKRFLCAAALVPILGCMRHVLYLAIVAGFGGCGHGAGAPQDDAGIATGDDSAVTPHRGTVRVTVLDPDTIASPAVGVPVVFLDPDGTLVATVNTDGDGKAQADVLPGGSVTAVETPQRPFVELRTTLGIQPGDELLIGNVNLRPSASTFTVQWPAAPGNPAGYSVYGPCGIAGLTPSDTLSLTFLLAEDCAHDPMEILVWAHDSNFETISFDDARAIPFVAGGSAMLLDAWSSGVAFRASYTNLSGVTEIIFDRRVTDGYGFLEGGHEFTNGGPSATFVVTVPTASVGAVRSFFLGGENATQVVWQPLAGDTPSYELDGERTLLSWLPPPEPDASRQRIHIGKVKLGTSGAAADLLELDLKWERNGTSYAWTVFGPDADDIQLPTLPATLGPGFGLMPEDNPATRVVLYEADELSGYDAVRASIGKALAETFHDPPRGHVQRTRVANSDSRYFFAGR